MLQHLTNAGSGRLNPHAPLVEFIDLPAAPPPGTEPRPVEVHARCTFTATHGGSPARVHGGAVASVLDEALGMAATVAGASGMTAEITVRFRAGTPYGVPVDVSARFTHREGRKGWATGEMRADGVITAEATALFISERSARESGNPDRS
jgi:acyl-coenzyme A thioesterase PaaI-like protein